MDAAYVILKNDGVWLVDGQGGPTDPMLKLPRFLMR